MRALEPHWRAALASGQPFAADDPTGLAWALSRLDAEELAGVRPGEALFLEQLSRPGLAPEVYAAGAQGLAELHGGGGVDELLDAIERADTRGDAHADHLLSGLFAALAMLPEVETDGVREPLRALATGGRRASTRRLATVARIAAEGSIEPAWAEAVWSAGGLIDLLDAAALLDDPALAAALFPRVRELLDGPPPELADALAEAGGTRGRFVRIELPGPERTLTLAEVEVLSGGENVAPSGTASQSSVNWGGLAERAIDGNTSGSWADGGQSHTLEDQPDPWWQLDLGAESLIDAITIWNRTDARWGQRLDGYVLRVLDTSGRTVFQASGERAPDERASFDLSSPAVSLQRAAVACLAALGVRQDEAVTALVGRFDDEALRPFLVRALAGIPVERWPEPAASALAGELLALFEERPEEEFLGQAGRELLALADAVAPGVEPTLGQQLLRSRRRLGPQIVVLRPVRDALLYDRAEFTVVAGRRVELLFDNVDIGQRSQCLDRQLRARRARGARGHAPAAARRPSDAGLRRARRTR
jgi:hypothetical protein